MLVENGQEWKPKVIVFTCNWCTYAAADMAGFNHFEYPAQVRIIRTPCSGRFDPLWVIRALSQGADGVLLSGCHPGDCHYGTGNYYNRRRQTIMKNLFQFLGIEAERFQTSWISGSEANKFQETMVKLVDDIRRVGPNKKFQSRPPLTESKN